MEDSIEVILQDPGWFLPHYRDNSLLAALGGAVLTASYGLWTMFVLPGFRKVPMRLKTEDRNVPSASSEAWCRWTSKVPYLPSSAKQTANVMKLLEGRRGRLADLGSGDGRLVFAACSAGFQCTGFEINSILLACARSKARWKGIPPTQVNFVSKDFWTMEELGEKLIKELPRESQVIACRFPFPTWPSASTEGSGLDQVWAYDIDSIRRLAPVMSKPSTLPAKLPF
ncbi:adenine nucleotide translocase lysine N-methyltransferase isoform X2 [Brienomyrus brachyistius]|uniref:adenine nucleotide translocase lysine N-methyltransferase isoform X2 n=1 Tax=Brienomyrus brachyistius TaxID=42636 RepID=UPI0020B1BCE4|nr:adenine nucleotide translocase lysine N-methyltransferase isoform X2 [Brienomyrus brachyistius]